MEYEYLGSWLFNRGQEVTLWKGSKAYRVSVQLMNSTGNPFKYLVGRDDERLLYRAVAMVARDVAKDGQHLVLVEQEGASLPFKIRTEDEDLQEFLEDLKKELPKMLGSVRGNILVEGLPEHKFIEERGSQN